MDVQEERVKSTHEVCVVPIKLEPHPNADSLSVVKIHEYQCVVRTEDWKDCQLGAYIPPDSVCPDTPEFAFLGESKRIKTVRLRGIISMGLLWPAPEGAKVGDNVAEVLGITHYEPPVMFSGGQDTSPPTGIFVPKYDVDSIFRFAHIFTPGEPVYVSEKIHGENCRILFHNDELHLGSHTKWKKREPDSEWWRVLIPEVEAFCRDYPGCTVYGEAYGKNKGFKYGDQGTRFVAFDVLQGARWWDPEEFCERMDSYNIPTVPVLGWSIPFDMEEMKKLAEGPSLLARAFGGEHVREGCVVKPMKDRSCMEIGRVLLKLVGNGYYEAGGGKRSKKESRDSAGITSVG